MTESEPNKDRRHQVVLALIAAIAVVLGSVMGLVGIVLNNKMNTQHAAVNSRMDQMLKLTHDLALFEGNAAGRAEEKAESDAEDLAESKAEQEQEP